jgi:hypothetical protein
MPASEKPTQIQTSRRPYPPVFGQQDKNAFCRPEPGPCLAPFNLATAYSHAALRENMVCLVGKLEFG